MKIVNFGSLNIDYVFQVESIVQPGQTINTQGYTRYPGGKGLNQSLALARAGAKVYHAGYIGEDGLFLRKLLQEAGVDCSFLRTIKESTGSAFIQVDSAGQNCIAINGGANRCLTPAYCQNVLQSFNSGDMVVLQNEINCLDYSIELAWEKGLRIVLNPSPIDESLLHSNLSRVSLFVLNEHEGRQITGHNEPQDILSGMAARYPYSEVVLTLGPDGAVYSNGKQSITQPACPASVVDTTAAGDTFTGYLLACMAEGIQMEECLRVASKAAALSISRKGAAASIPLRDEIDAVS